MHAEGRRTPAGLGAAAHGKGGAASSCPSPQHQQHHALSKSQGRGEASGLSAAGRPPLLPPGSSLATQNRTEPNRTSCKRRRVSKAVKPPRPSAEQTPEIPGVDSTHSRPRLVGQQSTTGPDPLAAASRPSNITGAGLLKPDIKALSVPRLAPVRWSRSRPPPSLSEVANGASAILVRDSHGAVASSAAVAFRHVSFQLEGVQSPLENPRDVNANFHIKAVVKFQRHWSAAGLLHGLQMPSGSSEVSILQTFSKRGVTFHLRHEDSAFVADSDEASQQPQSFADVVEAAYNAAIAKIWSELASSATLTGSSRAVASRTRSGASSSAPLVHLHFDDLHFELELWLQDRVLGLTTGDAPVAKNWGWFGTLAGKIAGTRPPPQQPPALAAGPGRLGPLPCLLDPIAQPEEVVSAIMAVVTGPIPAWFAKKIRAMLTPPVNIVDNMAVDPDAPKTQFERDCFQHGLVGVSGLHKALLSDSFGATDVQVREAAPGMVTIWVRGLHKPLNKDVDPYLKLIKSPRKIRFRVFARAEAAGAAASAMQQQQQQQQAQQQAQPAPASLPADPDTTPPRPRL